MSYKISPTLEREILALAADGKSATEISAWLLAERGVKISRQNVNKRLRQTRVARADVAKAVVREALTKTVVSDLDRLSREQVRVERLGRRLHARTIRSLDAIETAIAHAKEPQKGPAAKEALKDLKIALLTVESFADLALKATNAAAKLADRKLHFSGADADDESHSELADAEQRIHGRIDSLTASLRAQEASEEAGDD